MAGKRGSRRHATTRFNKSVVAARTSKLTNVRSFRILESGKSSTSFNNDNSSNFSGEKKYNEEFRGVYFLGIREKTLNQIIKSRTRSGSRPRI